VNTPGERRGGLRRVVGLLTLRGVLRRVRACPLCAALVVVDGEQRHQAVHRADTARTITGDR
jgi:hypothetical protein